MQPNPFSDKRRRPVNSGRMIARRIDPSGKQRLSMNAFAVPPSTFLAALLFACASCTQFDPPPPARTNAMRAAHSTPQPLVWDAMEKTYAAQAGESLAEFTFTATNLGTSEVVVSSVEPSCGCTVADLPGNPWQVAPGTSGTIRVKVDFSGKRGELIKSIVVHSDAGQQTLQIKLSIQPGTDADRVRNQQMAQADRQAVFRGDCARCHATPTARKMGYTLYRAACAICHDAQHRASMVPDLTTARNHRDATFYRMLIEEGRANTLMPAFAQVNGGPLTMEQIESLVRYLTEEFPLGGIGATDGHTK